MTTQHRRRDAGRRNLRSIALLAAAATILAPSIGVATAANADPETISADSASHAHGLWVGALGLNLVGGASSQSQSPTDVGPNRDALNVSLLGALNVDLGTVTVPLLKDPANPGAGGLLDLGSLGAIESYGASPSSTNSVSSSGLITDQGALNLNASSASGYKPAKLDLSAALTQVLTAGVTDAVLDQASVSIGALGSHAESNLGQPASQYMLADAGLDLHSKVIGQTVDAVDGVVSQAGSTLNGLTGSGGALNTIVSGLVNTLDAVNVPFVGGLNASLSSFGIDTSSLVSSVRTQLLQSGINNGVAANGSDASINIDLSTGTIHVDLAKLLVGPGGGRMRVRA